MPINCTSMTQDDINEVMHTILYEFPICEIGINIPQWMESLGYDESLKSSLIEAIKEAFADADKFRTVAGCTERLAACGFIKKAAVTGA